MNDRTAAILDQAIACDMTCPWVAAGNPALRDALPERYRSSGWTYVSLTIASDGDDLAGAMRTIAMTRRMIAESDNSILVETVDDIRRAKREGKLALGFHFQGTLPVERDLNLVSLFYALGVRHMLMVYNYKNFVADGCYEKSDGGLSGFGHDLVAEMNRVGMIVDVAHTGYKSSMDTIAASKAPVIVSHGNLKKFSDHPRCYTDEQIRAIAGSGGVFGLTGLGVFMGGNDSSTPALIRQIDHIVQLVGLQHVGFGFDYVYDMPALEAMMAQAADRLPKGDSMPNQQQIEPERLGAIVDALLARNYSDADIAAIIGGNWLRICEQVWR
ncbi:dipeptidase [Sphingosinicella microcystinivorans]|uniref:Dipeptidase n=1 Tax=Sphingosinicella microcystinivorans TaxID=335406 RepID=A0AAD1D5J2_SPHMI|nr:membrane dipeptidase [Sphingosinicella microcystinivorans]RKS91239.1 membrane dipeptidase [Sphingosinicella microcystinivorans]BBE34207.1 dipeptidase [Sphingosinicella microcystinivorans]